jgi:hypothetical protein
MADPATPEQQAQAVKDLAAILAKGGSPTAPAPATQQFIARWNDETKDFDFYKNPNYAAPKATATTAVSGSQYGTWEPDPSNPGQYRQVVPPQVGTQPNPDEDVSKAVKRQNDEAERNERIANQQAGKGYLTTKEVADITNVARARNYDDARLAQEIANQSATNKREDDKLAIEQAKLPGTLAQTTATTARIGAETGQIVSQTDLNRAQMDVLGIKTEADRVRAVKAGLLDDAQAEKIRQELLKPQPVTTTADQPFIVSRDANGQLITEQNQNYQGPKAPTTRGELAQRTALLRTQMQQMKDKIAADQSIRPDQQAARFSSWYDQNVAPQVDALEQQQQAIIQDETQKALEQQRSNLTSASSAMQGLMPYRVGPGYGQAFESLVSDTANTQFPGVANKPWNPPAGWSTFKAPNLDQSVHNLLNAPAYTPAPGMDFRSMLDRNQWTPGGAPPPTGEGAAPAPTPEQAAMAANPNNSPLGAIGANPMLAAQQAYNRQLASQQTAAATGNPNNSPFGAIGPGGMPPMPQAAPMPMAIGNEPLAYNPAPFRNLMPLLPGYNYTQSQNPYQWPFGGGGGGAGFTAGP